MGSGVRGIQRRMTLAPAPESARAARRLVSEVCGSAGADEFVDTAALLTSEIVTNGIVHAHTDLQITVDASASWVRVEVVDGNSQLPVRREYDEAAMTGRGLEMVELLADDFGVEPLDGDGKRVWFRLGAVPGAPAASNLDALDSGAAVDAFETKEIRLLALPVALYCAWQQHADALLREATLVALEDAAHKNDDYPMASRALSALADAASGVFTLRDDDIVTSDTTLAISIDALHLFPILRDLLARATVLAAAGQLLTPPSLPEIVAVRRWVCDEIARQSAGLPPTPWAALDPNESVLLPASEATLDEVRTASVALVAADVANRIIAVSAPAAELLGWEVDELEGRRLVSIIPPRLRDRHIAGFTRHLIEGTSHILGRPASVPALRRDGSEVEVSLLIERRADPGARALFVATLTPR